MAEQKFELELAKRISDGTESGRIKTKNGHTVRIICWDAKGMYPLVGLIDGGAYENVNMWTTEGKVDFRYDYHSPFDLIIETD